jgi:integrase
MQGHLQQRGSNSWRVRVYVGRDDLGKKRYVDRTVRGSKREAQRVMARLVAEVDDRRHVPTAKRKFGDVLDEWLEVKASTVEESTIEDYRYYARTYIQPALGHLTLDRLRTIDLDRFYARLRLGDEDAGRRALSARTVRLCHTVVAQALDQARKWGFIATNVARDATLPRGRKKEITPPTIDVLRRLLEVAAEEDAEFGLYLRILAATGYRRGEGVALRWTDLDTEMGDLTIRRSIAHVGGRLVEKDTKTHQARRIAIDPATLAALEMHRAAMQERSAVLGVDLPANAFVFTGDDFEQPWRPYVATNRFIRIRTSVGASSVRLHDLRHFVATNLGSAGTPIATISGRLGHRDVATTLNVYSHFLPADDRQAARTLGDLLD